MTKIPNLDELLNYDEEYNYPDLIMSDYFSIDNTRKKDNKQGNKQPQEQSFEQPSNEETQEQSSGQPSDEQTEEQSSEQQSNEQTQEQNLEQQSDNQTEEQSSEQQSDNQTEEQSSEQQSENQTEEQNLGQQSDEETQEQRTEQQSDENDFENLMNNYEEDVVKENDNNENQGTQSPSDKLNDITTTKIYNVLKKLVSLSYDRYQKGTYKYDKKEIVKHYLTNQKFKILDDLVSPTFKPDVYVFDLSPSNNESLEMYVNAISSVAIKNSLIYLTYNDCILRKLIIKKGSSRPIDVSKIATSQLQKYNNFDCVIFNEYRSLYEELREIKNRKIYIFSDFDISSDISKLSQENQDIVWFSTEKSNYGSSIYQSFFYREYPTSYAGYYVETSGIEDIEKFIMEKNKAKYKRRSM